MKAYRKFIRHLACLFFVLYWATGCTGSRAPGPATVADLSWPEGAVPERIRFVASVSKPKILVSGRIP